MDEVLQKAFLTAVERVAAWADLLDSINVFPVADGDTGRNLAISLSPLRSVNQDKKIIIRQLLLAARGNSGNIAARFLSEFYLAQTPADLPACAEAGCRQAWQSLSNPRPGTMLSVFDALTKAMPAQGFVPEKNQVQSIIHALEDSVHDTYEQLPKLKKAGVVDAGALGMYIFMEGFFYSLSGLIDDYRPLAEIFKNRLSISPAFREETQKGFCVDFVLKAATLSEDELKNITHDQESVIVVPTGDSYKIHLHTDDREKMKSEAAKLGSMVSWEDDNLAEQISNFPKRQPSQVLHIMTDAAGSVTREDANKYGITLLNSYITLGDRCLPETHLQSADLYNSMRQRVKVSTAQASVFERHQLYENILSRFDKVLYLCVGSAYTGNYDVAGEWKIKHDEQDRMTAIDTGAASGRLGIIALATARYLSKTNDVVKTISFARQAVQSCEEYVFLDKLQYLANGGRLPRASAIFGDILKMKPVISPQPEGVRKIGVVRNRPAQIKKALERLEMSLSGNAKAFIMLEYSDNYDWVNDKVKKILKVKYPQAEIFLQPLSLTSAAHMGPGTWAVAFLPDAAAIL
jgi:hypothetical protein